MDMEAARAKVSGPGIALLVIGILGILTQLASIAYLVIVYGIAFANGAELGDQIPSIIGQLIGSVISFGVLGFICYGAMQMRGLKGHSIALASAILACIPCCVGPCCIAGLPVGIWAAMTLNDEEVKAAFAANQA